MKHLLLAIAMSTAAHAAPAKPPASPTVRDLLDAAAVTCPALNAAQQRGALDEAATIKESARTSHLSKRDADTLLALCAMYHLGRADQIADRGRP